MLKCSIIIVNSNIVIIFVVYIIINKKQKHMKQIPEYWYVVKDENHPLWEKFKGWFNNSSSRDWSFFFHQFGYSGQKLYDGYDSFPFDANQNKMVEISLEQWHEWFYDEYDTNDIIYKIRKLLNDNDIHYYTVIAMGLNVEVKFKIK